MRRLLTIFFLMLLSGMASAAQNMLPDTIKSNLLLQADESPYYAGKSLVINEGVTLTVEAGVQLLIPNATSIRNNGRLVVRGDQKNPVLFTSDGETGRWGYIYNTGSFIAEHLFVRNATRFITSYGDTVIISSCDVADTYGTIGDDCVGAHNALKVLILNSRFTGNPESGKTDAIDLDGVSFDTISGNYISGFSDDGVDIGTGSRNMVVTGNVITECDMAISIGENSTALVADNLLTHCVAGIQSHYGSVVTANRNTLYGNIQGLRAFHNSSEETSGGTLHITNSIISNCINNLLVVKSNSVVTLTYCLTDSLVLPGAGNIAGNPMFVSAELHDFSLKRNSPAIDAGDPDYDGDGADYLTDEDDRDPDGTRIDIGYASFFQSSLRIIEISPSNLSLFPDDSGVYSDWIKIYNSADSAINLSGYFLSDNPDNPDKHRLSTEIIIEPEDTLLFRADNLQSAGWNHLSFKLSGEGEFIGLWNPGGIPVDGKYFSRVPVDYIYKRVGLTEEWVYSEWPVSDTSATYSGLSSKPVYSPPGGAWPLPVSITLSASDENDSVWYSTDGSDPSGGTLATQPVSIPDAVTVRTVSQRENYLPGYIHAETYFPENRYKLPVISVSTNEESLYGPTGIYTNYSKSSPLWERAAAISYYDGENSFSVIAGIRIQGGNSVWMPKKSLRFHFRGGYGASSLNASPFKGGPSSFKNIVIRSGYDDDISTTTGTMLRDPFSNELWSEMGELATKSAWGVLLLNNGYQGIYNVRESINEYFVSDNLGIEAFDLVRFQKWGADLKYGTWDEWNRLITYFDTTDFSRPEAFDETGQFMDMNSLLNLLSLVHCTQFRSWTWGAFAIKPSGGKWSWTIWDTDRSYNIASWNGFNEYASTSAEKWPNFIPQKLLLNEKFRNELVNRNCDLLNTLFIPETAISVYDSLVEVLTPEIDSEYERWSPLNRARWDVNNESVRSFLRERPAMLYDQMKSYFSIDDTTVIKIKIIGNGEVLLNSLTLGEESWSGIYMKGVPVSLVARPAPGSTFIEWMGISNKHALSVDPAGYTEIIAVFAPDSINTRLPLVINEIMYHPPNPGNSEWLELYNPNEFSVSLGGFTFSDGGLFNHFDFPEGTIIDPDDYLLIAGNLSSFGAEYGMEKTVNGSFNSGETGFNLSNGGEMVRIINGYGKVEDSVIYLDSSPWPIIADGQGPSMQLLSPDLDNSIGSNWFADIEKLATPGRQNEKSNSVPEVQKENQFRIYPNPVGEQLFIELPEGSYTDIVVKVYTLQGREVAVTHFSPGEGIRRFSWQHTIEYKGLYLLKISSFVHGKYVEQTELLLF